MATRLGWRAMVAWGKLRRGVMREREKWVHEWTKKRRKKRKKKREMKKWG